jgi:ankyrin repeat protein
MFIASHVCRLLCAFGSPLNAHSSFDGSTALHIAGWLMPTFLCIHHMYYEASRGHIEAVRFLVANGASVELEDNFGNTPLMFVSHVPSSL